MKSIFPFSLENIPRQTSFACLSLKFGSILSASILILYSIYGLVSCLRSFSHLPSLWSTQHRDEISLYAVIIVVAVIHAITLFLSTLMMIGVLKEKANFIRPWVILTTLQVLVDVLIFIFWTTLGMVYHYSEGGLSMYVLEFLELMIRFYTLMIVSSHYKKLQEETVEETEKLRDLGNKENWNNTA